MCRNIKTLFNFDPPASQDEVRLASIQFVRKISGFKQPSAVNQKAFQRAVDEITRSASGMLGSMVTAASPRNRDNEAAKAHSRAVRRFGTGAP